MSTLSKQNKGSEDGEGETSGGDSIMFESDVVDLPLAKSNDDQHLVQNNIGEDGEESKKKKKKKQSEERKHDEYSQFKSDECEEGDDGTKMEKKRRLIEGDSLKDCNDFRSDGGEDGEQCKKLQKKKKKLSEESKQNDYKEVKSNEREDEDQGKKMKKKKKLIEGNTFNVRNDASNNEGEDGERVKKLKKKKKKRSEECENDYKEVKSNEREDEDQGKKMKKKKKLIEGNTFNVRNDASNNEGEDGERVKKLKKRSEECEHKDYNKVKSNECEDDNDIEKKVKKKKLIEGGRLEECNDVISNGDADQGKTKKKNKPSHKRKSKKDNDFNSNLDELNDEGNKMKKKKEAKAVTSESPNSASKPKRVTFSDHVEKICCDGLVRGKRFTPEEDEIIKAAVQDYIDSNGLGDEGVDMVLHSVSHPSIKGCWKVIAQALPHRPVYSVSKRGHVLFENNVEFEWTPDEREFVRKTYEQHGPNWRAVADALGKSRDQVKDLWRRIKYTGLNKGAWSQEEYETLFNLVNQDLRLRALEPYRKSQHGMLRDNICWEAISHKLKTRDSALCCSKWYKQLISPMTGTGEWLDSDDFRLIGALYALDACCMEEVDWDNLIEYRSGDVCRQRWDQMVQHIGDRAGKSFIEQVEILAKRFCPDLLEAREAFESKPVIC